MRTFKIYSLSNFQICNTVLINYSHHIIHYFPMIYLFHNWKFDFPEGSVLTNPLRIWEIQVGSLGRSGRPPEKEIAIHFSILARKIPCTEEPDGLQSVGSQKESYMT